MMKAFVSLYSAGGNMKDGTFHALYNISGYHPPTSEYKRGRYFSDYYVPCNKIDKVIAVYKLMGFTVETQTY